MANAGKHAVVLGASMTGLTAARALANHFDRVTLVERLLGGRGRAQTTPDTKL